VVVKSHATFSGSGVVGPVFRGRCPRLLYCAPPGRNFGDLAESLFLKAAQFVAMAENFLKGAGGEFEPGQIT